jgi:hypothetical protein
MPKKPGGSKPEVWEYHHLGLSKNALQIVRSPRKSPFGQAETLPGAAARSSAGKRRSGDEIQWRTPQRGSSPRPSTPSRRGVVVRDLDFECEQSTIKHLGIQSDKVDPGTHERLHRLESELLEIKASQKREQRHKLEKVKSQRKKQLEEQKLREKAEEQSNLILQAMEKMTSKGEESAAAMIDTMSEEECHSLSSALAHVSSEDGAVLLSALSSATEGGSMEEGARHRLVDAMAAMDGEDIYDVIGMLEEIGVPASTVEVANASILTDGVAERYLNEEEEGMHAERYLNELSDVVYV